ncbi:hypothetical protein [Haloplasma contractile]|uniref:Uncharacterized protein n=1 Tax=Haloplasma contractile SSD-17B TaxID=1033810 RepID=F7PWY8_9MOLU|nr:hypothetical protein [Haloplasma contractile]ERJ12773.1 hypothetical protein HLPCO_001113 [Haloplasma contractile SSD-17B]
MDKHIKNILIIILFTVIAGFLVSWLMATFLGNDFFLFTFWDFLIFLFINLFLYYYLNRSKRQKEVNANE